MPKFVLHIFQGTTPVPGSDRWQSLPLEVQKQVYSDYAALERTPGVQPGLPLGAPSSTRTVEVRGGETVVREGTYLPEALSGYLLVDADDMDAAIAIAAKVPAARLGGAVEVRVAEKHW